MKMVGVFAGLVPWLMFCGTALAVSPNDFKGADDSAVIQAAVDAAAASGENTVTIPAMNARTGKPGWTISRTILLPSGMTIILESCRMTLADNVFCNLFANSKAWAEEGLTEAGEERDIAIVGVGHAVLDGGNWNGWGEHTEKNTGRKLPKSLHHNCTIYFHNVRNFKVEGLHIRHQRYWGMCYSFCSFGEIRNIRFEADLSWANADQTGHDPNRTDIADGEYEHVWIKNGDGCDLRGGCHDILIDNVSGFTEDDGVAMTTLPGQENSRFVGKRSPDIWNVTVRNNRIHVWRYAAQVRLLCSGGHRIHDISIDGIMDPSPSDCPWRNGSAVLISDCNPEFVAYDQPDHPRRAPKSGEMSNISIRNVWSKSFVGIRLFNEIDNLEIESLHLMEGVRTAVACPLFAKLNHARISGVYCSANAQIGSIFDWFKVGGEVVIRDVFADKVESVIRNDGDANITWENVKVRAFDIFAASTGGIPRFGGFKP